MDHGHDDRVFGDDFHWYANRSDPFGMAKLAIVASFDDWTSRGNCDTGVQLHRAIRHNQAQHRPECYCHHFADSSGMVASPQHVLCCPQRHQKYQAKNPPYPNRLS